MENILANNLKNAKLKVTPQRMAIYSYLINTKSHPSAETIYKALKPDHPSMSFATVYKNVAALRDAHLIMEFNVGEDSHRYDANTDFHTHLVCRDCHNVYDYYGDIHLDQAVSDVKGNTDFIIEDPKIIFYGVCKHCLTKKRHNHNN